MYDFSGRHVSIRGGTAGQIVGDLIIDARTETRINLGSAEAAVTAAKFLAGMLRKVEGWISPWFPSNGLSMTFSATS